MFEENLCALIHGEPGTGKSWMAQTMPGPRLIIDAEGGSRHPKRFRNGAVERLKKVVWDPTQDGTPPEVEGDVSVQVFCRDFLTMQRCFEILNSGAHPFRSVAIDSLTEVQKRCKDAIAGGETMTERMWGDLLTKMELLVRSFRDLAFHPTNPLDAILFLALTQTKNGKGRPAVQGALGTSLPGYVDLEGYLAALPNEDGEIQRKMLIQPHALFEAKDRTHTLTEVYGGVIVNPDVEAMLGVLNESEMH